MERLFTVPAKAGEMYVRGGLCLRAGEAATTDTYFGCLQCAPYARYTNVGRVRACAVVQGRGRVSLRCLGAGDAPLAEQAFDSDAPTQVSLGAWPAEYPEGCLYLRVEAEGDVTLSDLWYEGEGEAKPLRLAIVLCTFRREEQVARNLKMLSAEIDGDPLLRECVSVICVDNGRTLAGAPERVRLVPNRNFGGSGGYARGMLEAEGCTHLWMMDDDIGFEPSILRRAVTFLRHRRRDDLRLAAGMFPFEAPTVQHEATARFDGYTFASNGAGLDFRDPSALLRNRVEGGERLYGGWWSMVFPATGRLPMPFFIKLDDVEYGLRGRGDIAVMDGFGVWHEAFGGKGNAWSEYYTTRNTLILQALDPSLPHSAVKTMAVRLLKALAYGEPKCMEAALRGARDYAAGPEAFAQADPETRHGEIMRAFGAKLAADMTRGRMLKSALRNLARPGSWRSVGLFFRAVRALRGFPKPEQRQAWEAMGTADFWRAYLHLDER